MTKESRARILDVLKIASLSIMVATALFAALIKLLDLETAAAHAADVRRLEGELKPLILDARQWAWCGLNEMTPEQCRLSIPPDNWRAQ